MDRMDECMRLLALLEGCPQGAPEKLLMIAHGFPPSVLYQCVDQGLVHVEQQTVSRRRGDVDYGVFRFYISERGRSFKKKTQQ